MVTYIIFKVSDQFFGLDVLKVHRVIDITAVTPLPQAPSFIRGVIHFEKQNIKVVDFKKLLQLRFVNSDGTKFAKEEAEKFIIQYENNRLIALHVDEIIAISDVAEESVSHLDQELEQYKNLQVAGMMTHNDTLVCVLDGVKID